MIKMIIIQIDLSLNIDNLSLHQKKCDVWFKPVFFNMPAEVNLGDMLGAPAKHQIQLLFFLHKVISIFKIMQYLKIAFSWKWFFTIKCPCVSWCHIRDGGVCWVYILIYFLFFQEENCHFLSLFKIFYCTHRAYQLMPTLVSIIYIIPPMAK